MQHFTGTGFTNEIKKRRIINWNNTQAKRYEHGSLRGLPEDYYKKQFERTLNELLNLTRQKSNDIGEKNFAILNEVLIEMFDKADDVTYFSQSIENEALGDD